MQLNEIKKGNFVFISIERCCTMDIQSLPEGQKQTLQQLLEKLLSRNKFAPSEIESFEKLMKNVRDAKNFHKIMEKFKIASVDSDIIEDKFKDGRYVCFINVEGKVFLFYDLQWLKQKLQNIRQ